MQCCLKVTEVLTDPIPLKRTSFWLLCWGRAWAEREELSPSRSPFSLVDSKLTLALAFSVRGELDQCLQILVMF